ncbi:hypothetical protein AB6A40_003410 [Gnathostoma spinigerum]|uniref:Peptidase M13 C-terminal domain-containing protein n=1 Tax=Gnathostoma spinigerum TaxID=75299 RepID=A0ABD6EAP8_9BILA
MNYGSVGMVTGHEITHGFDDTGRQYNEVGGLRNWWDKKTLSAFIELKKCFISQYGEVEVPQTNGMHINGEQTQGENIADNGGIRAAYTAMKIAEAKRTIKEKRIRGIEKYGQEQLFFINYAYSWCMNSRPEATVYKIIADPHSPNRFRVNIVLSNFEKFAEAFDCPKGSKMSSKKQCRVW